MPTPIANPDASGNRPAESAVPRPTTAGYAAGNAATQQAAYAKSYAQLKKEEELAQYESNHVNQSKPKPTDARTADETNRLNKNRRTNPPTFYDSDTGATTPISSETEDSLILLPSSVKRMAAKYVDSLIGASPPKTDYSAILAEAVTQRTTNITNALADLDSVTSTFEAFKVGLQGNGDSLYQAGTAPLLKALSKGYGKIENQRAELKFMQTLYGFSERRHATNMTDETKKEWRSWKRVLVSYP